MLDSKPLVVLTRPAGENAALALRLKEQGLRVLDRPLIELRGLETSPAQKRLAIDLDHKDIIIFVSKSAVRFAMPLLDQYWPAWPIALEWFAVGEGTASALRDFDVQAHFPDVAGSEGLLALPGLNQVSGKKIVIARGLGGRELLAATLQNRGAQVAYFETYRRDPVHYDDWPLDFHETDFHETDFHETDFHETDLHEMDRHKTCVVLTSGEIVEHFANQVGNFFSEVHLIVPSVRIADKARALGCTNLTITGGASEQALYDAVLNECRILDG